MDEISEKEYQKYVTDFLIEFKALIHENRLHIKDHDKNRNSLLELGLTGKQREEILLSLLVNNYCSGPIQDEYKPGHYWVFGVQVDEVEIYIKLKIAGAPGAENAICFSFHKSERPLKYPFTN
jgi:hypothetical protein